MNLRRFLPAIAALIATPTFAQTVVNSINAGFTPDNLTSYGLPQNGNLYTPSSTFTFNQIDAKFSNGSGGNASQVQFSVYTNVPNQGGTLLASSPGFAPTTGGFVGAQLNTTLTFNSGQQYFVIVSAVGAGAVPFYATSQNGATAVGAFYGGSNNDFFNGPFNGFPENKIILQFLLGGTSFAATPSLTPNQGAIAANIDSNSLTPPPGLANVITGLQAASASELPGALSQLTPTAFGQFTSTTANNNASFATEARDNYLAGQRGPDGSFLGGNGSIDASHLTLNDPSYDSNLAMVHSRLLAWNPAPFGAINDSAASVLGGVTMKDPKDMKACCGSAYNNPWNFYVAGNVVLAQGFSDGNVSHFDSNTESVTLGTDYRINQNFLVGLSAGYGHTDSTLDNNGSSATADSYSPGFYASYADKGWYANLSGDYLHNAYTQSRVIGFLGQTANSAPEGNQGVANLDGGYDFHLGHWTVGPLAGIQYMHLSVDGYRESGSDADLSVNSQDADSLRSRLGGRVSFSYSQYGVRFTPHLDASWQHEFMDQSRGITSQFTGAVGSFSVQTSSPSRDSALVDIGLDAELNQTVTLFADYEVQAGQENYFGQSVQAGVKIGF